MLWAAGLLLPLAPANCSSAALKSEMAAAGNRLADGELRPAVDGRGDSVVAPPPMHPSLLVRFRRDRCMHGEEVAVVPVLDEEALPVPTPVKLLLLLADKGEELEVT